jgi:HEXXH motif-containing protein
MTVKLLMSVKLPLLDEDFDASQLMDAVARKRMQQAQLLGHPVASSPDNYLDPREASKVLSEIYGISYATDPYARGSSELSGRWQELAKQATDLIFHNMPGWQPLEKLPVVTLLTPCASVLSYSCICHPQHIFLGVASFSNENIDFIAENFLHEYAHNWLYLLEELSPFSVDRYRMMYTLPSGTPYRSVTGVIDAAYVAAALRCYYRATEKSERRRELTAYVGGCLMQIRNDPDLTRIGLAVCRRLAEEIAVSS